MARPVKTRSYSSSVRAEQAAATRVRIVDAAGELFVRDGYARTTVKAIAELAGVAVDTVYAVFGSKPRVLTALVDARLSGPPSAPPVENVTDRPQAQAVRAETDQRRQLQLFAADIASISERVRPIFEIMRTASAVEPEMATVFAEMDASRLANMTRVAGWLASQGDLSVSVERAGEIIWALASPDVARMLCDVRGWTNEAYAGWLATSIAAAVLRAEP